MIIKVYTSNFPEVLHIIEGATDITVYGGVHHYPPQVGNLSDPHNVVVFDQCADNEKFDDGKKIDFTKDGIRKRLWVFNHAYICNDEGRTVEKVSAH